MHWDEGGRKLMSHGKTEKTIGHSLREVKEEFGDANELDRASLKTSISK